MEKRGSISTDLHASEFDHEQFNVTNEDLYS